LDAACERRTTSEPFERTKRSECSRQTELPVRQMREGRVQVEADQVGNPSTASTTKHELMIGRDLDPHPVSRSSGGTCVSVRRGLRFRDSEVRASNAETQSAQKPLMAHSNLQGADPGGRALLTSHIAGIYRCPAHFKRPIHDVQEYVA
jgi:hypothetical protein